MAYVSQLQPGELVINDKNAGRFVGKIDVGYGMIARDWQSEGYGSYADPFDLPLLPRSEWPDRIAYREQNNALLTKLCDQAGSGIKNQQSLPYCWIFGVTRTVEITRVVQGQPVVSLSPASAGGPITGYVKRGGYGSAGLKYVREHGLVPSSMWPDTAVDRKYDTPETRAERPKYRVQEWYDVVDYGDRSSSFDRVATCLLLGIPLSLSYNWWGHLVCGVDLVRLPSGKYGIRIDNSWGANWGTGGRSILEEGKGTPDAAECPRTVVAS